MITHHSKTTFSNILKTKNFNAFNTIYFDVSCFTQAYQYFGENRSKKGIFKTILRNFRSELAFVNYIFENSCLLKKVLPNIKDIFFTLLFNIGLSRPDKQIL